MTIWCVVEYTPQCQSLCIVAEDPAVIVTRVRVGSVGNVNNPIHQQQTRTLELPVSIERNISCSVSAHASAADGGLYNHGTTKLFRSCSQIQRMQTMKVIPLKISKLSGCDVHIKGA